MTKEKNYTIAGEHCILVSTNIILNILLGRIGQDWIYRQHPASYPILKSVKVCSSRTVLGWSVVHLNVKSAN